MKITKDRLLRLTENYIGQRVRSERGVICIYMVGSLLEEDPFINQTTDVDLLFIHEYLEQPYREIIPIIEDITIDIIHESKHKLSQTKNLRLDPWLGSTLCFDPVAIFKRGHWFEFIQASTEAAFFLPEVVLYRSHLFLDEARNIYLQLKNRKYVSESVYIKNYLQIVENGANAISCLSNAPLPMRKLMTGIVDRAKILSYDSIPGEIYGLILGKNDPNPYYDYFFNSWKYYFEYFGNSPLATKAVQYNPSRFLYYENAVSHYWKSHLPSAIWIMLNTWSDINPLMGIDNNDFYNSFVSTLEISSDFSNQRLEQLDSFIDLVDECLEDWGNNHGITHGYAPPL